MTTRPRPRSMPAMVRRLTTGLAMPLGSVLLAFVLGGLIVAATGGNPFSAYAALVCCGFGIGCAGGENPGLQISNTIVFVIPLITAGIAVALPFRAGLFNIGAEGQLLAGSIACTAIGIKFSSLPSPILLPMVLVGGMVGGALWAGVAGLLKATIGPHEVVTMLIAGGFAGLAGAIEIAGVDHNLTDKYFSDTTGFDAIAVALLGLGSAVGIVLAAILFGALHAGGSVMQADAGISGNLVFILQALILFSIAANFVGAIRQRIPGLGRPTALPPDLPPAAPMMTEAAAPPTEA